MSHIVDICPSTKFPGGLRAVHCADDDATEWLDGRCIRRRRQSDRQTDRQTVSHYLRNFVGGGNEIHFVPPWVVASDETLDLPELIHITNGN